MRIPATGVPRRHDDRHPSRQRDLPAVGMPGERHLETMPPEQTHPPRRVHQKNPNPLRPSECVDRIRLSDDRIIDPADKDLFERRGEPDILVDQHADTGRFELLYNDGIIHPEIMISQDGIDAVRRVKPLYMLAKEIDLLGSK